MPKNVVVKHQFKPEFSQQRRGIAGSSNRLRVDYDAQADQQLIDQIMSVPMDDDFEADELDDGRYRQPNQHL